jgi:hypothetical protein
LARFVLQPALAPALRLAIPAPCFTGTYCHRLNRVGGTFLHWFNRPGAAHTRSDLNVPLYFFQITHGKYSGISDLDVAERNAAWAEMTKVCGDLVGGAVRDLKQNSD